MNLAPNGKPTNLTPEQYRLVRTPAFKEWFGDWENSPETASKVVDENGEPLVVYHGTTNKNINIFRPLSYFTENYSYAKVYGLGLQYSDEMDDEEYDEIINRGEENVYSVFLNIVNPLKVDRDFFTDNFEGSTKVKISKIDGYDGMINTIPKTYSPFYKENENQFLIFNSNQIKLADGTNTTFDSNNPDIRYSNGGGIRPFTYDGNKNVVYSTRDYKIAVDNVNNARYITLWFVNSLYDLDVKVGSLALYKTEDDFLKVSEIDIQKSHRGKGMATKMYLMALKYSADNIKGIKSYLPDRVNKRQIPKIYKALNAKNGDDDYAYIYKADNLGKFKKGGSVNLSKTPAPKKDRIYGSSKNKPKSSESKSKASSIILNPTVLKSINTILKEHNEDFPKKKVPLSTAKAVVRRGMGAFSSSYRPTISGGKPNSRVAWGLARLKAFVYKIQKGYSKSGKYKQDNDLIEELGYKYNEYKNGGQMEDDKTFELITYFVTAETDRDSSNIYKGTDYERAKLEFDSANISDFDGGNGGMVLFQKVLNKYKFIGDLEDGYYELSDFPIEDYYKDKDYYEIIENGEFEHIDSKDVTHINYESNDLLHDVESYYQKTYGKWKYNEITVDNGKDENDDDYKEYGCIQLRITNHSENVNNNDKFGRCDYYISVVIANRNPTKDKFLTSMYERRRNEIELNFDSDDSFDEIINEIDSEIANGKLYIAEKLDISVNDVYKNGGEMKKLDDLYKDHHNVWAISEKIIKNVCEENCSKYSDEIHYLYELELKPHFIEEEKVFFPSVINENNKDLIKELIKEHHLIKFLAQKIKLSKKTKDIKDFCNLMIEHIRKEELIMKTISNDPYKNTAFRNGGLTMKAPSQINKMPSFIAPNGNTSNLISIKAEDENGRWVYLYDIVRTPAFKNWFGDWEEAYATKDYEGVSKIIDENGEPSVCYHATSNEFFEFDENYIGSKTDSGYYGKGFYFTEGTYDSHYGEREIPCFLNIMNPLSYKSINRTNVLDTNELKEKGYDGVLVFPNYVDVESIDLTKGLGYHGNNIQEIVAYYPEQIKLADATNRTFNKYDSDIRYKNGGNIPKFNIESSEGEEDRTTISLKGIGKVVLVETFPEYEFTEDIDEDNLNDLGLSESDMIGKIEHIEIKDEYKGKGYAKLLMKKAIELAKQKGLMPLYLNASPMGSKRYGLSLEDLTDFYESFGFKVFLNQGNNNLMILKEEDVKFNEGGNIPMKEEYKYFLVLKLGKPVFKVKFSKYNKETERDMSDMLDKLNDMDYSLKPITQQEYKDFDYSKVNKEDILEFTKNWTYLKNGGVVEKSNKIEFRRNRLPRNDIYEFAKMVKSKYPKVWDKGGNIFGNEAFVNLERVLKRGYWLPNEEWMQIKWQSYIARHHKDFRIEGVVAMLKWIGTVDKGWAYMKKLINEEIEKKYPEVNEKYKNGGQLGGKCPVGTEVQSLLFSKDEFSMEDAKEWAKSHGYKYDYVDEKENTFRIRQENPSKFVKDIFRTIEFKKGLKAIVACPKN